MKGQLIVSCQALPGEAFYDETISLMDRFAIAAQRAGAAMIRANGLRDIQAVKKATGLPVIGLIKKEYPGYDAYITPTENEIEALLSVHADVIALDCTHRQRANLAIILVDARSGVITQTRRHTYLVSLLGIKHVVLAVNKMDLVGYDRQVFDRIVTEYRHFAEPLGIPDITCIPLSALKGDNVVEASENMSWYTGKPLLEYLETVHIGSDKNFADLRYPVQYVMRPNLDFRGFSSTVASGIIRKGDEVVALPSMKRSRVKSIVTYDGELDFAFPPQAITVTLEDEIDISRGEMLVHPDNLPIISRNFEAMLVWMDEKKMDPEEQFFIKHTTNLTRAKIDKIRYKVNVNTLEQSAADALELNEIARVIFTTGKPLFFDPYSKNKNTGAFILIDPITNNTCAVGMIIDKVEMKDMQELEIPEISLSKLGIGSEHFTAIEKVAKELDRQGITVKIIQ